MKRLLLLITLILSFCLVSFGQTTVPNQTTPTFTPLPFVAPASEPDTIVPIHAVQWSPDGNMIAFGGGTSTCSLSWKDQFGISIWNVSMNQVEQKLVKHTCEITALDWSADSQLLVSASYDEIAVIWDVKSQAPIVTSDFEPYGRNSIQFSNDASKVLNGLVYNYLYSVWDAQTGETIDYIYTDQSDTIRTVAWSSDNSKIASGSADSTIAIVDAKTYQILLSLQGHKKGVCYLQWKPDDSQLASTSEDGTVRIWNAMTGQILRVLSVESRQLKWHPTHNILAVVSDSATSITFWNTKTGELIKEIESDIGLIFDLDWHPDGTSLVYVGKQTDSEGENLRIVEFIFP